jgi:hypothetical protein
MTHWMCTVCGFLVSVEGPPCDCPSCKQACTFNDVTCYRPECGGEQNVDPLLVGATLRAIGSDNKGSARGGAGQGGALREKSEVVPLFRGMKEEQKEKVLALGVEETIPSDTAIFSEGDEAKALYIVKKGRVAIKALLQGGKWAPVCAVSSGEIFGWSCLVPPYVFTASATSLEETLITSFSAAKLRDLFTREPGIGYFMMQNVAELITSRLKNVRLELLGIVYM